MVFSDQDLVRLLAQHEIAEAGHRILNPFTERQLMLLGEVSRIGPGTRILDLACGKGELLCRWAATFGSGGQGVDISEVFIPDARARATELGVADLVSFTLGDAAGVGLVEMVLADGESWDRYVASQWWTVHEWLKANPGHEDAPVMRDYLRRSRESYLGWTRRYLGWGVFVLRP
jgi:SAM-dependent methyltransferase